jgi:hypothetical protein
MGGLVLGSAVMVCPVLADASGSVSLAPVFKPGDVARYDFAMTSDRVSTVAEGERAENRFAQSGRLLRRVVAAGPEEVTLSITFERVKVELAGPGLTLSYDSAADTPKEDDTELVRRLRLTVGVPLTIKLDATGAVVSVEGNVPPTYEKDDPRPPHPGFAQTLFGDTIIKRTLGPLYRLPGAPATAAPGATWSSSFDSPQPPVGRFKATLTHELEKVEAGMASVKTTGEVTLTPARGNSAVEATLKEHAVTGTAVWDTARGVLASYTDSQRVLLSGADASGVMRTLDSKVTTTFTLVPPAASGGAATDGAKAP